MSINLTQDEIDEITAPLVMNSAKIRHLRSLGFTVKHRADGKPLVSRENYTAVMGGTSRPKSDHTTPNLEAIADGL